MNRAYGLYSHIRANRIRSVILLVGFVVLLEILQASLYIVWAAFTQAGQPFDRIIMVALKTFGRTWPISLGIAIAWFAIAFYFHNSIISLATGAKDVERKDAPQLYNALENLCISRGIDMPRLQIMESGGMNAYASGIRRGDYVIAVTRGLIDKLTPDELEAVLAHELTHIINKDSQMMVIAIIFSGIFAFFADLIIRPWDFPYGVYPQSQRSTRSSEGMSGGSSGSSSGGDSDSGSSGNAGGAILAIVLAVVIIMITWGVSMILRFMLSRSREYMADAGAVELTKRPDAMISALKKISANPYVDVPSRVEAFFIDTPIAERRTGILSTHPSTHDRIEALVRFAGGRQDWLPAAKAN
jgi:heat shock protein HtpX